GVLELPHRHAEEAGRLPEWRPGLREPGAAGVAHDVRCHVGQSRCSGNIAKRPVAIVHSLAVPFHNVPLPEPLPAAQVRQKPVRYGYRRAALLGLTRALRTAVEDASNYIDPAFSLGRLERRGAGCARARASIGGDQKEFGHVPPWPPIGGLAVLDFAIAPGCPDQLCYPRACAPLLTG